MMRVCSKCGAEFILESYHNRPRDMENICHRCLGKDKSHIYLLDLVEITTDRLGYKPDNITLVAEVPRGSVGLVIAQREDKAFLVSCGGFLVWVYPEYLKHRLISDLAQQPDLQPRNVADMMLDNIKKELEQYE